MGYQQNKNRYCDTGSEFTKAGGYWLFRYIPWIVFSNDCRRDILFDFCYPCFQIRNSLQQRFEKIQVPRAVRADQCCVVDLGGAVGAAHFI